MKIDKVKLLELASVVLIALIAYYPMFWLLQNDKLAAGLSAAIAIFMYFIYQDFLRDKLISKK